MADVRRLRTLVDDLMEISRFDADAELPASSPWTSAGSSPASSPPASPRPPSRCPREPVIVDSDPRRLDRILGNLLDNARDHAPGAPVEVSLTTTRRRRGRRRRGPGAGRVRATRCRTCSTGSTRPTRRGAAERPGWGSRSPPSMPRSWAATLRARARPGGGLVFALTLPVTRSLPAGDAAVTAAGATIAAHRNPHRGPDHDPLRPPAHRPPLPSRRAARGARPRRGRLLARLRAARDARHAARVGRAVDRDPVRGRDPAGVRNPVAPHRPRPPARPAPPRRVRLRPAARPPPRRRRPPTATPAGTTIVRAYFFLGSFTGDGRPRARAARGPRDEGRRDGPP